MSDAVSDETEAGTHIMLREAMAKRSARLQQTQTQPDVDSDTTPVVIEGYEGLGDNLYQRPYVLALAKTRPVYVWTPWPELYQGYPNVFFVKPDGIGLRTQWDHIQEVPEHVWSTPPANARHVILDREECIVHNTTFLGEFDRQLPEVKEIDFEFKVPQEWKDAALRYLPPVLAGRPFCLVKPPVLRDQWTCPARNPNHKAFRLAIARMRLMTGLPMIAVANLVEDAGKPREWLDGDYSDSVDYAILRGMPLPHLIGLFKLASCVICSPSYALPLGVAVRTPTFVVYGGHLAHKTIYDERMGGIIGHVAPEPFCECNMNKCPKCSTQEGKFIDAERINAAVEDFVAFKFMGFWAKRAVVDFIPRPVNSMVVSSTWKQVPPEKKELRIAVPSGIGDIAWSLTKIAGIKKLHPKAKINIRIQNTPVNRALDFVKHFDFVDEAGYENFEIHPKGKSPVAQDGCYNYLESGENKHGFDYYLLANGHLERGGKLEDWLPELGTDWDIAKHWKNVPAEALFAEYLIRTFDPPGSWGTALFYFGPKNGNTIAGHNRGQLWTPDDWALVANNYLAKHVLNRIIIVGATYDADYTESILSKFEQRNRVLCMVGKTTCGEVFELARRAHIVIGYPSGIPIFSAFMGVKVITWMRQPGDSIRDDINLTFHTDMKRNMVPPFVHVANDEQPLYQAFEYGRCDGRSVWNFIATNRWA